MRISKLRKGMLILASAIVKRCIAIDRRLVRDCKNVYLRLLSLNLVVTIFCTHAYSVIKMISQGHQGYCPIGYLSPFLFIPFLSLPLPSSPPAQNLPAMQTKAEDDIRTTSERHLRYWHYTFDLPIPFPFPFPNCPGL